VDSVENVGEQFNLEKLEQAQNRTWQVLHALSSKICEGMTEEDAHQIAKSLFHDFGVEKIWHPSKIRFAENTLKSFRELSTPGIKLKLGDPYFLDLGLVFFDHEGDCGQTFVLGENSAATQMIEAGQEIYAKVKEHWQSLGVTGPELYDFASKLAQSRGYELNPNGASGHRIGDFPHAIHHKGVLKALEKSPIANRWILEIQLKHPSLPMGAFYEDLLK